MLLKHSPWADNNDKWPLRKQSIEHRLEIIRGIRNIVAHFKRELTVVEQDQLKNCSSWLQRWVDSLSNETSFNAETDNQSSVEILGEDQATFLPIGGRLITPNLHQMIDYLQHDVGSHRQIQLTFREIEQLIGETLPDIAKKHRSWWSNGDGCTPSQAWLAAGWRLLRVNMVQQAITLTQQYNNEIKENTTNHAQDKNMEAGQLGVKYYELNSLPDMTGFKPVSLRFPGGSHADVRRWKDVLKECCVFVLENINNITLPYPDKTGKKRFLLTRNQPEKGTFLEITYKEKNNIPSNELFSK